MINMYPYIKEEDIIEDKKPKITAIVPPPAVVSPPTEDPLENLKTTGLYDSEDYDSSDDERDLKQAPTEANHMNFRANTTDETQVIQSDDEPEVNEPPVKRIKTKQATLEMVGVSTIDNWDNMLEETAYHDVSPCGSMMKGDLILTTAQSCGHPRYIKNQVDARFQLVGKIQEFKIVQRFHPSRDEYYDERTFIRAQFAPLKISNGTYFSSQGCALTPINECFRILASDENNLTSLDEGTAVNVRNGFIFRGGRWMMKYNFGW